MGGQHPRCVGPWVFFILVFHPHWDACAPAGLETRFDGNSAPTGAGTYLEGSADERALAGLDGALLLAGVKLAFFDERVTERPVLVSLWEIFPGRREEQPGTARSEK